MLTSMYLARRKTSLVFRLLSYMVIYIFLQFAQSETSVAAVEATFWSHLKTASVAWTLSPRSVIAQAFPELFANLATGGSQVFAMTIRSARWPRLRRFL